MNIPLKLDFDKLVYWFEQFKNGDVNDPRHRERLIDGLVNKVIVWNDRIIITYNINGLDGKQVTVEQIIEDFEKEKSNLQKFDSLQFGAVERT